MVTLNSPLARCAAVLLGIVGSVLSGYTHRGHLMSAVAKSVVAVEVEAQPDPQTGTVQDVEFDHGEMEAKIARGWSIDDQRGTRGRSVAVGFIIYPDGDVRQIKVVKSSGSGNVDVAAIRAVFLSAPFRKLRARSNTGEYNVVCLACRLAVVATIAAQ